MARNKCTSFLKVLFLLINAVIIILLGVLIGASINNEEDYSIFNALVDNWNRTMYQNFSIRDASPGNTCYDFSDDYVNILEKEYWPGTVDGCVCGSTVYTGTCSERGLSSICMTTYANGRYPYKQWKNSLICAKPYYINNTKNYNYFDIFDTDYIYNRRSYNKTCGFLSGDNYERFLTNTSYCPIGELTILGINDPIPWYKRSYYQVNGTKLRILLNLGESTGEKIASSFLVSSQTTCSNPSYRFYNNRYPLYPKNILGTNDYCPLTYTSSNFMSLDSQDLNTFLYENVKTQIDRLPNYDTISSKTTMLSYTTYISVIGSTRQLIKSKYGSTTFLYRLKRERFNPILSIISLVFACFSVLLLFLSFFLKEIKKEKINTILIQVSLLFQMIMSVLEYCLFDLVFQDIIDNIYDYKLRREISRNTNLGTICNLPIVIMVFGISLSGFHIPRCLYVLFCKRSSVDNAPPGIDAHLIHDNGQENLLAQPFIIQQNNLVNQNNYNSSVQDTVPTASNQVRNSIEAPCENRASKKSDFYEAPPEFID